MKKTKVKQIILIILIIINCITIFTFSSQEADESSGTSSKVVDFVMKTAYKKKNLSSEEELYIREKLTTPIRKGAHFSVYLCLGLLTYVFTRTLNNVEDKRKIAYALAFCFLYACSDELHQIFVPGRSGEIRDVIIDTCGALTGILITIIITSIKDRKKE